MHQHAEKSPASAARRVPATLERTPRSSLAFVNRRPEAAAQQRLQAAAQASVQLQPLARFQQLAANARPRHAAPPSSRNPVVQRMTLLPFASADKDLTGFVEQHASGMAGEAIGGTPARRVRADEKLVLVGHGNGAQFYSHDDATHQAQHIFDAASLAAFLAQHVLPDGYAGDIVVWSCNAATPWKNIPSIKQQIPANRQDLLDQSFIRQLDASLRALAGKNYLPTVSGAIGFVSLSKPWNEAEVYVDETLRQHGPKKPASAGFITTNQQAPATGWYDILDDSDASSSEDEYGATSSDEAMSPSSSEAEAPVQGVAPPAAAQVAALPLSALYPGYQHAILAHTAGAKTLRELGNVMIPSNIPPAQMAYFAMMKKNNYL